ncbi:MAG: DUF3990 domain-containing protein [Coriobacteriales bacterium]|jgi:hypothetical protein|nr:DUF3990 domain-containing protein [Coriobacteriales bacterium]
MRSGLILCFLTGAIVIWFLADAPKDYDILIGPVANDAVGVVLNQFVSGIYGNPDDQESKDTAVRLLLTQSLHDQVFFGTERAVSYLRFLEVSDVRFD